MTGEKQEIQIGICQNTDAAGLEEVCEVIRAAQDAEYEVSGISYNTHGIDGTKLSQILAQSGGVCYTALAEGRIVGTLSVVPMKLDTWYLKGTAYMIKYVAVLASHQGRHIASMLVGQVIRDFGDREGTIAVSTDIRNRHAVHLYERNGFLAVDITRGRKAKGNAIKLAYWKDGCPYSTGRIRRQLRLAGLKCKVKEWIRY